MPKGDGIKIPEWQHGQPSKWVQVAGFGQRVVDYGGEPLVARAVAQMLMIDRGVRRAEIHGEDCPVGKTSPNPCDCTPEIMTAQVTL